jgi:hypothetical protein
MVAIKTFSLDISDVVIFIHVPRPAVKRVRL